MAYLHLTSTKKDGKSKHNMINILYLNQLFFAFAWLDFKYICFIKLSSC
jgi:hypothetical protein